MQRGLFLLALVLGSLVLAQAHIDRNLLSGSDGGSSSSDHGGGPPDNHCNCQEACPCTYPEHNCEFKKVCYPVPGGRRLMGGEMPPPPPKVICKCFKICKAKPCSVNVKSNSPQCHTKDELKTNGAWKACPCPPKKTEVDLSHCH